MPQSALKHYNEPVQELLPAIHKNSSGVVQLCNSGLLLHVTRNFEMRHHPKIPPLLTCIILIPKYDNMVICISAFAPSSIMGVWCICWHLAFFYRFGAFSPVSSLLSRPRTCCSAMWNLLWPFWKPASLLFSPQLSLCQTDLLWPE